MFLTDDRIGRLLDEEKPEVDADAIRDAFVRSEPRRGHRRLTRRIRGVGGTPFVLHLRQSRFDVYDFSVILAVIGTDGRETTLRRHNGLGHPHRNHVEGNRFSNVFHIHLATERYQEAGWKIDGYAIETDRFSDLATALDAMLEAAHFEPPAQTQIF